MKYLSLFLIIPAVLVKLLLMALGLIFVPLALGTRYLTLGPVPENHWPDLFWLWGNDEEHCPEWWLDRDHPWYIKPWPRFWWYAIRNPANNHRFLFEDTEDKDLDQLITDWDMGRPMEAIEIKHDVLHGYRDHKSAFYFKRKSWRAGYRKVWLLKGGMEYRELWAGWKLGSKVPGLAITLQFRKGRIGQ